VLSDIVKRGSIRTPSSAESHDGAHTHVGELDRTPVGSI